MTTSFKLPLLVLLTPVIGASFALPAVAQTPDRWTLSEAVGAPDWLAVSGTIRPRAEALSNPFKAGATSDQVALTLVTNLQAEASGGDFVIGAELQDSRLLAQEGDAIAAQLDAFELGRLYVAWRPENLILDGDAFDLSVGRLTFDIGSRRLIARANFSSVFNSFEGVGARWTSGSGWDVRAVHVHPRARRPGAADRLDNKVADNRTLDSVDLSIVSITAPVRSATLEGYLYALDEDDAANAPSLNRDLLTWGARLHRDDAPGQVDLDIEYARQSGSSRETNAPADISDLDHSADMAHVEFGYTFGGPRGVRVSALYDYASGDRSPFDGASQRFDNLYGDRSFEFGPTSIFGALDRANLSSVGVKLETDIDERSDALIMVRQARLDEPRDSYAASDVRDVTGLSGRDAGTLVELRYRRWLIADTLRLQTGLGWLSRGDFFKTAPNATSNSDPLYSYLQATWEF